MRTAYTAPTVDPTGAVFVMDGTEVFRFEQDGSLTWRVAATAPELGIVFTREGFPLIIDSLGFATAYDPITGEQVAQLEIPAGIIPRPDPLPQSAFLFRIGAPFVGFDPDLDFIDFFIDAFNDFNVVVGNNSPAVHSQTGRIYIAVSANPSVTEGVFYGIDFTALDQNSSGELEISCSAPIGLASGTSPAISADGKRVYAGDSNGFLTAFSTDDCSVVWTLDLEAASLASPTVGLDGRFFMLVSGKVTAFQDNGTDAEILWQTDLTPIAQELGFSSANFNSVLPLAANYLYGAATFRTDIGGGNEIPSAHTLATIDLETGEIVSMADLGEESDSAPSLGADGMIYVPSKPILKAVLMATPLAPFLPPAKSGIFAFEPASFKELTLDGLQISQNFKERAEAALDLFDLENAATELERAVQQLLAVKENHRTARDRDELSEEESEDLEEELEELLDDDDD